jgi:hypothetical protein
MSRRAGFPLVLLGLFAVAPKVGGTNDAKNGARNEDPSAIALCKVLKSPELYKDRTVKVIATYRVGLEASELYCLSCSEGDRVWVEFDSAESGERVWKNISRLVHKNYGTVNGVFTGIIHFGRGFGHLGAYQVQFSVASASTLKLIDRLGLPPSKLSEDTRKKVCQ